VFVINKAEFVDLEFQHENSRGVYFKIKESNFFRINSSGAVIKVAKLAWLKHVIKIEIVGRYVRL
jgi:hypothetical protein